MRLNFGGLAYSASQSLQIDLKGRFASEKANRRLMKGGRGKGVGDRCRGETCTRVKTKSRRLWLADLEMRELFKRCRGWICVLEHWEQGQVTCAVSRTAARLGGYVGAYDHVQCSHYRHTDIRVFTIIIIRAQQIAESVQWKVKDEITATTPWTHTYGSTIIH